MKQFILFARVYTWLMVLSTVVQAQNIDVYPNYVVIGAFASENNAINFTKDAIDHEYQAHFEINPNRNLFYVYVMTTDNRLLAFQEALKLRKETKYWDTWVYSGILGNSGLVNNAQRGLDFNPSTEETLDAITINQNPPGTPSGTTPDNSNDTGNNLNSNLIAGKGTDANQPSNDKRTGKSSRKNKRTSSNPNATLQTTDTGSKNTDANLATRNNGTTDDKTDLKLIVDPDGRVIVDPNQNSSATTGQTDGSTLNDNTGNNPEKLGPDGKPLSTSSQNVTLANGQKNSSTANQNTLTSNEQLLGPDGKPLVTSGQNVASTSSQKQSSTSKQKKANNKNQILGPDGKPLANTDQNVTSASDQKNASASNQNAANGNDQVLGPDGKPLAATGQNLTSTAGNNNEQVLGPDGKPLTASGQNVASTSGKKNASTSNQNTTNSKGQVLGPDGKPLASSGQNVNPTTTKKNASTSNQNTANSKDQVLGPDGKPLATNGQTVSSTTGQQNASTSNKNSGKTYEQTLDANGKPMTSAGQEVTASATQTNASALKTGAGETTNKEGANSADEKTKTQNMAEEKEERFVPVASPQKPLTSEEVVGKDFVFQLYRATNRAVVDGEVDAIDFEKSRRMATYKGNEPVKVIMPSGQSKKILFVSEVFGYRKLQKEFDPKTPSEEFYLDENNHLVVPFELIRLQKGDIAIMYNVFFFKDAGVMRPESRYEVNNLLELLTENPSYKIVIHGHTNGNAAGKIISMGEEGNFYSLTGTREGVGTAKRLSEERAEVMMKYLVSKGIDKNRMQIKAWGGKKPIHDKHAARAHENVRVEIEILSD